jgi:hypothetical protein|tara:strand:- start:337 stop:888 length:552 start_codon:yes stop_codon:yes gene_type:complete
MLFGNLSTGVEIFAGQNNLDGTWTPDKEYTLVDTNEGDSLTNTYTYALYKVSFENSDTGEFEDPEWRLYGEGKIDLRTDTFDYVYQDGGVDSVPTVILSSTDSDVTHESQIPYIATYATKEEGETALKNAIPKMGCRDKTANNYDYTATMDDGNCGYDTVAESSALSIMALVGIGVVGLIVMV